MPTASRSQSSATPARPEWAPTGGATTRTASTTAWKTSSRFSREPASATKRPAPPNRPRVIVPKKPTPSTATASIRLPPAPIEDFGKYKAGTYQSALEIGHRLGVFASSDHISQHVSYGGVYTEDFSRKGIVRAFNERRTIAATDKIYVEFSCNGHPLGSIFDTAEKPRLKLSVDGTADLKRVTLVRNEDNYQVFDNDFEGNTFTTEWTDDAPLADGENRYYLRVEQVDGNMAWSSPVWVTIKAK